MFHVEQFGFGFYDGLYRYPMIGLIVPGLSQTHQLGGIPPPRRAGAPSPADGFARRNGLSRYPMRGFVRADTMVGIVPMHGFVRAQPQWFVDAGSRCMVYTNPPSMPPHGN